LFESKTETEEIAKDLDLENFVGCLLLETEKNEDAVRSKLRVEPGHDRPHPSVAGLSKSKDFEPL
jgi:hypothetical protein